MEPTRAPWAAPPPTSLPPVARGETTTAPWARAGASALPPRPLEVAIPATPRFPTPLPDPGAHPFQPARKCIASIEALRAFLSSPQAADFLGFALALNEAVRGLPLSAPLPPPSQGVAALLAALDALDAWVDEIPPAAHSLRYGNPSFRVWFARLRAEAPALVAPVLPEAARRPDALAELVPYFIDSFGNETRIDYGTGHETTFVALLYCLARVGAVTAPDAAALVLKVFARYLRLMRRLQTTYWLEPAGSHGVWGLDDYQFWPFIWGAAQLTDHPNLRPSAVRSDEALDEEAQREWLYLAAVGFLRRVKKGPLGETSPMLADISGVPSWSKVNKGLVRMYQDEVLGKLPIMQHFLFGSLLRFEGGSGGVPPGKEGGGDAGAPGGG